MVPTFVLSNPRSYICGMENQTTAQYSFASNHEHRTTIILRCVPHVITAHIINHSNQTRASRPNQIIAFNKSIITICVVRPSDATSVIAYSHTKTFFAPLYYIYHIYTSIVYVHLLLLSHMEIVDVAQIVRKWPDLHVGDSI